QPTPTHGGRPSVFYFFIFGVLFQPTPTHGGRLVADRSRKQNLKVSTHAHARRSEERRGGKECSPSWSTAGEATKGDEHRTGTECAAFLFFKQKTAYESFT